MNMRLMGISAKILHSMWIIFLLHIVFLDGNADGFMFLKGSKRSIQEEQTPQDFKRSLMKKMTPETKASFTGLPPNATLMLAMINTMEMKSPRDFNQKREFDEHESVPACQFRSEFVRLDRARLARGNTLVKVNQRDIEQYHLQYSCVSHHNSCTGIDSSRYFSRCEAHMAGVSAWVFLPDSSNPDGWSATSEYRIIKVAKACVCRLSVNTHH